MTKVMVYCTQEVSYKYEVDVPEGVDIEEYVYETVRDCDEYDMENGIEIFDYSNINIDDIEELED